MSPRRQFLSTACSSVPRETPHSGRTDLTITCTEQPIRGSGPSHAEPGTAGQRANTRTSGHHTHTADHRGAAASTGQRANTSTATIARTADHRGAAGRYERSQLVAQSAIKKSRLTVSCEPRHSPGGLYLLPRTAAFHVKPHTRRGRSGPHEISRPSRAVDHRAQPALGLQRPSQAQRAIAGSAAIAKHGQERWAREQEGGPGRAGQADRARQNGSGQAG